jgi:hypothetical protein
MTRSHFTAAIAVAVWLGHSTAAAQSLQRRFFNGADGSVEFTFASRSGACGDGLTYLRDGFGGESRISQDATYSGRTGNDDWPACVAGPVRVVGYVTKGELLRLHSYIGPRRQLRDSPTRDVGTVSVSDAVEFLAGVVGESRGHVASDAILPIVLADSINPWPTLLRFARDERLSRNIHSSANFWLSRGATAKLGLTDRDEESDDDVRSSAVFALSQQAKDVAIPRLIDVARRSPHPSVRAQALFWLGQSGDQRAVDLFEEILLRR